MKAAVREAARGFQPLMGKSITLCVGQPDCLSSFSDALYKSEGPLQVSLLMIKYLMKRLADTNPKLWKKHLINYDNICNVARLKLLQGLLDLPEPFSSIWKDLGKVIDPLHIKNH